MIAHLVNGTRGREGLLNGDPEHGIWTTGMVQGLIHDVPSVRQLIERIVDGAEAIIAHRLLPLVTIPVAAGQPTLG